MQRNEALKFAAVRCGLLGQQFAPAALNYVMPAFKLKCAINLFPTRVSPKCFSDGNPVRHKKPVQYVLQQVAPLLRLSIHR